MLTTVVNELQPQFTAGVLTCLHMPTRAHRIRESCGATITAAQLAKHCGVSRTAAGKWLKGGEIKAKHLFKIADLCGVRARWLELGQGPRSPGRLELVSDAAFDLAKYYDQLPPAVQQSIADLIHTLTLPETARKIG